MKTSTHSLVCAFIMAIAGAFGLTGCSNSPNEPSAGGNGLRKGETFTYYLYQIDSSGKYSLPDIIQDSVTATGLNVGSMTNVCAITERIGGSTDIFGYYLAHLANGDFVIGDTLSGKYLWDTLPSGSRQIHVLMDTTASDWHEYEAVSYISTESVSTPAGTFTAIKLADNYSYSYELGQPYGESQSRIEYMWYVPALGIYVKLETHESYTSTDYAGHQHTTKSGGKVELQSYN